MSWSIATAAVIFALNSLQYRCEAVAARLRLQGPLRANGTGRVEVFHDGEWGSICDDKWDINDARVACRQLGYLDAIRALPGLKVPFASGRIWLSDVSCTGEEENITSCSHPEWGTSKCSHSEDAGVECKRAEKPSVTVNCSNLITVHQGDSITCVCRGEGGIPAASVTWYKNQTQVGETGIEQETLVLVNLDVSDSGSYKCVAQSDQLRDEKSIEVVVYVFSGYLRLRGPFKDSGTGRVEIFHNGQWGTICDNHWDIRDARVVCRQLGYVDAVSSLRGYQVSSGSGRIWLSDVACTGSEQNITGCSHGKWGDNKCRHSEDAGVECTTTGEIASVRLKGPLSESGIGRVEILHNGEWGTICDDGWDLNDAKVVCRQLGYLDAVRSLRGYMVPSGDGQIWLDEVGCTGRESSLTNCSYTGWGKSIDCQHSDDAGVECTNEVKTPPVRLKGPLSEDGTGRVEVFFNGEWGTICDDTWNTKNARVVCRQLGYPDAARTLARSQVSPGSGPIWLDNVVCTGREKSLDNCQRGGWGHNYCSHYEDAGVECSSSGAVTYE
ncbi:deleted in malignant brain tumors 1 protein-like [Dendronephthya gigantea]|uniref:deleted in malignant brain tumors 1 protein-like n=1 Tax=Dendronephthya gigantea TaxID=151771 RepID=UPI00106D159A|nr:deleted in malignant brain tumors 1 protein-like [Dendronephthya gigantea]